MKRLVRKAIVTAALIAVPTLFSAPAFAATSAEAPKKAAAVDQVAYENEVVKLTNAERTARGCKALRIDDRLVKAARAHSEDMVKQRFFDHTGSDGSNFVTREVRAGYPRNGASAENIAYGYRTPQQVVTGWMNSSGHRKNILNCSSIAVGVGLAMTSNGTPYWTQDFGRV
ncbi:CAP domain-containing protein [Paractinoplanes lichenicola]|uniref:CAP domain-containing protein n=1 Tax=Paractinoplanes lichenicola TaxID=2802976 RepID=A0ABS1VGV8_9ACTN|nr:CAP domain-containing protein [Actinoplanes lichenicola]MBL7253943.1 CAP domain-containing protein [Actinoplanes lichenicola]